MLEFTVRRSFAESAGSWLRRAAMSDTRQSGLAAAFTTFMATAGGVSKCAFSKRAASIWSRSWVARTATGAGSVVGDDTAMVLPAGGLRVGGSGRVQLGTIRRPCHEPSSKNRPVATERENSSGSPPGARRPADSPRVRRVE